MKYVTVMLTLPEDILKELYFMVPPSERMPFFSNAVEKLLVNERMIRGAEFQKAVLDKKRVEQIAIWEALSDEECCG